VTTRKGIDMNKATRLLVMAGMGLMASAAFAGPASAASASPAPIGHQQQSNDRVISYFRTPGACARAERIAERTNRRYDYDCSYVRFGFHRRTWVLTAHRDNSWGRPPVHHVPGHDFPGHHGPGHNFPGNHGH
jgi:hypothetical protein